MPWARPLNRDAPGQSAMPSAPLPFVLLNMAMTADGKIATANRHISSFGSPRDQTQLLRLRATADAVMCGARTVEGGEITLGPGPARFRRERLRRGLAEYNLRILVSGTASLDPEAEIFKHRFSPIVVLTTARAPARRVRRLESVADAVQICGEQEIDFRAALAWLAERWRIRRLLCEGGGELNAALFAADLVDELRLTVCPWIFGGAKAPTIAEGAGIASLADAIPLALSSLRRVGEELFLVYRRVRAEAERAKRKA